MIISLASFPDENEWHFLLCAKNTFTPLSSDVETLDHVLFRNSNKQVKLVTIVEGDQKAPFSIATSPKCREGCYSFPRGILIKIPYSPHLKETSSTAEEGADHRFLSGSY